LPAIEPVRADELPLPYQDLLVHDRDMTPTLEGFHRTAIHLKVLQSFQNHATYSREVVLTRDDTDAPVEFGAIRIHLAAFPTEAQELILKGERPLGAILRTCAIPHSSRPQGFFLVRSDTRMQKALQLASPKTLYGRINTLCTMNGQTLAEIVEILPPCYDLSTT
jgi:chorismate-pyruvate lyase